MAGDLELERPLERSEAVEVLDLDLRAEGGGSHRPQADVALDPHAPRLHVGMGGADGAQQLAQRLAVGSRLGRRTEVGLGHDLHQRHARAVEVDDAEPAAAGVLHARGVLLEVRAGDADDDLAALGRHRHRQAAVARQREGVLADLVALGQVGVEVVLALEAHRLGLDLAVQCQPGEHHELHGAAVDDRQRTRHAHADGADARVRLVVLALGWGRRAGAEHLGLGPQLCVDLDPDDRLVPRLRAHRHAEDCTDASALSRIANDPWDGSTEGCAAGEGQLRREMTRCTG